MCSLKGNSRAGARRRQVPGVQSSPGDAQGMLTGLSPKQGARGTNNSFNEYVPEGVQQQKK